MVRLRRPKPQLLVEVLTRTKTKEYHEVEKVGETGIDLEDKHYYFGPPGGYEIFREPDGKLSATVWEGLPMPPVQLQEGEWVDDPMASPEWAKASEDASAMKDLLMADLVDWRDRILFLIFGAFIGYTIATVVVPLIMGG